MREIVKKTGSLDYSIKMATRLIEEGKSALRHLEVKDEEARSFLLWLADYIIKRSY